MTALGAIQEPVMQADGTVAQIALQSYYDERFFASWAGSMNGSSAFAIAFVLLM